VQVPQTQYARSGDVHIAYQRFGEGPDLVGVPPFAQNVEAMWTDPSGCYQGFLAALARFCRITHFDKRGTGLSDRVAGSVPLDERMDDMRAVMDAAGIERAFVAGVSEGGPLAMVFAATYPERVEGLILGGSAARFTAADDYPHGPVPAMYAQLTAQVVEHWGTPDSLLVPVWMPSLSADEAFRQWAPGYERACASPGAVREIFEFIGTIDVRDVLPALRVPTLVLHRRGDLVAPVEHGRYLAEHIPGATLIEFEGLDHVPWVPDATQFVPEIEEFVTGRRDRSVEYDADRVLATVLFTDIVDSTKLAGAQGDQRWRQVLDRHDDAVRAQLRRFAGREVKTTGDGFLATFESPGRAIKAACAIRDQVRPIGVQVRAGLHTGEVERRGDDVSGMAVHIGARVAGSPARPRCWCRPRSGTWSSAAAPCSRTAAPMP
jgi:pimeloyl-ACP methyl ester carboxylesterase